MTKITENIMIVVDGKPFKCDCGCNVFSKEEDIEEVVYSCNSCGSYYSDNGD